MSKTVTLSKYAFNDYGATLDTQVFLKFEGADTLTVTGSTFSMETLVPTVTAGRTIASNYRAHVGGNTTAQAELGLLFNGTRLKNYAQGWLRPSNVGSYSFNVPFSSDQSGAVLIRNTADFFNASNSTTKEVEVVYTVANTPIASDGGAGGYYDCNVSVDGNLDEYDSITGWFEIYETAMGEWKGNTVRLGQKLILNAPPTFTASSISFDTNVVLAGETTASVTVSNPTAYYGGTISSIVFKIGTQTATLGGAGTLSIPLNAGGTFTPTVTVTDSRGQTTIQTFNDLVVHSYSAPSVSFDVNRTTSTGALDDEGTYGLIEATLTFSDVIVDAVAPIVTLMTEDGTQTTPTVTWYTDSTLTTTVTWGNVSSGDTVYGQFSGLNTQYSYQVSVTPRDSQGAGTVITQTISSAFYTIDFLAGGHGIAFGKPASNVGFECAMDATFDETLTAQDMTQQEVDDFVDGLDASGTGWDSGADYLKLPDGTLMCWGTVSLASSATYARCTFSKAFVNTSYTAVGVIAGSPIAATSIGSKATDYVDINSTASSYARSIAWIAIGRWK